MPVKSYVSRNTAKSHVPLREEDRLTGTAPQGVVPQFKEKSFYALRQETGKKAIRIKLIEEPFAINKAIMRRTISVDLCQKEAEIAGIKADVKAIFKRIDEQLTLSNAVYNLVAEVKVMNERLQNLSVSQGQLKKDVEELKSHPGKRWEKAIGSIISAIIGGLIAYLLFCLGLG